MTPSKEVLWGNGHNPNLGEPTSKTNQTKRSNNIESLKEWYKRREFKRNIRKGQAYFNGPGRVKQARRHSPSQLLQCKRKAIYKRLKAPEESEDPLGIFWIGSRIEEDLVLPYLEECVAGEGQFVTNSMWVDFIAQTAAGKVRIKGATDPVIVNREAEPILPFEVKTKRTLDRLREPDTRHRAQAHAYLKGLSEKHDSTIDEAVILYVSRIDFALKGFQVEFDHCFWEATVLPWIADVTAYQLERELPPGDPAQEWECGYCPFRERCGKGEREYEDTPPTGLLPLFEYTKQKVTDYLQTHDDTTLTPTLANLYPELTHEFEVQDWFCRGCSSTFGIDKISWTHQSRRPPKCPSCKKMDETRYLRGKPQDQEGAIHDWG